MVTVVALVNQTLLQCAIFVFPALRTVKAVRLTALCHTAFYAVLLHEIDQTVSFLKLYLTFHDISSGQSQIIDIQE